MLVNELEMGDIVFFCDTSGMAEHTSMYIAKREGIHYIIHATTQPHRGLMITYLKEADINCCYKIVRPKNKELAIEAIGILLTWVEQKVPYANEKKINSLMDYLDEHQGYQIAHAGRVQEAYAKENYVKNYARYIEMANALPYIANENGEIKGLGCAESVVSAFNIALFIRHAIYARKPSSNELMFSLPDAVTLEEFISELNNPLPLDAISTGSAGLLNHCMLDNDNWLYLGILQNYAPIMPTDKNKKDWREFLDNYKNYSIDTQKNEEDEFQELQLIIPARSPRARSSSSESPLYFLDNLDQPDLRGRASSLGSPYQFLGLLSPDKKERSKSETFKNRTSFRKNPSLFFTPADLDADTSIVEKPTQLHVPVTFKIDDHDCTRIPI